MKNNRFRRTKITKLNIFLKKIKKTAKKSSTEFYRSFTGVLPDAVKLHYVYFVIVLPEFYRVLPEFYRSFTGCGKTRFSQKKQWKTKKKKLLYFLLRCLYVLFVFVYFIVSLLVQCVFFDFF